VSYHPCMLARCIVLGFACFQFLAPTTVLADDRKTEQGGAKQGQPVSVPTSKLAAQVDTQRYYIVELLGAQSGYMHTSQKTSAGTITTDTVMTMNIARGKTNVSIAMSSQFVETVDGAPVSMRSEQKLGTMAVVAQSAFVDGMIKTVTTQGGKDLTTETENPKDWLPPAAMERDVKARFVAMLEAEKLEEGKLDDPAKREASKPRELVVRTIDPLSGPVVIESKRKGFEVEEIEVGGKKVKARKVLTSLSSMPGVGSVEWIDDEGELLRSETSVGGLQVVLIRSDKETAMRGGTGKQAKAAKVPEIMLSTFVKPNRKIENARGLKDATYVIRSVSKDPSAKLPEIPSTGAQCVTRVDDRTARLRVSVDAVHCEVPAPADIKPLLASSPVADASDERIVALKDKILKEANLQHVHGKEAAQAEAIRLGVRAAIKQKTLDVGFATASETVRTGEGDCTEHAVLLVATLRAAGIPARGVTGLVYADQFAGSEHIFGYHMWAQALLDAPDAQGKIVKRWVDLDAALPGERFDATHIALGVTTLSEGDSMQSLISVAGFLGEIAIDVE
jgi:hypothetical protein